MKKCETALTSKIKTAEVCFLERDKGYVALQSSLLLQLGSSCAWFNACVTVVLSEGASRCSRVQPLLVLGSMRAWLPAAVAFTVQRAWLAKTGGDEDND